MASKETHYVLVVHGTWNPPREGERLWYQLDEADPENFCSRLNTRLDELGLGRAVWRAYQGEAIDFGWSGVNRHEDRLIAAKQLAKRIVEIATGDPTARIHLVAHSHGGNVALAAIQLYLTYLHRQSEMIWNFDDEKHRSTGMGFYEGPADELSPLHLPPVEESARKFGLGNKDLLLARWLEARDEYRQDTATSGVPGENEFKSWWTQSSKHNQLGRLVFLGTPFYYKRWGGPGQRTRLWSAARRLNFALDFLASFAVMAGAGYALIEVVWLVIALVRGGSGWPAWNPVRWSLWLHIVWLPPLALAAALAQRMTVPIGATNLYCEDTLTAYLLLRFPVRMRSRPVLPLKALVVTAGFLDEVLLMMASERIIKALLDDQVNRFVRTGRDRARRPPTGMTEGLFAPGVRRVILRLRRVAALPLRPAQWLGRKWLAKYLRKTLFDLVKTTSYGIDPVELRGARIDVSDRPRLERIIEDRLWWATEELARQASPAASSDTLSRYAFLLDPDKLHEQIPKSWLVQQIQPLLGKRDPESGEWAPLDELTSQMALGLEERAREIAGLVDLAHSHYYSNQEVIDRIARFIAREELPPGAR